MWRLLIYTRVALSSTKTATSKRGNYYLKEKRMTKSVGGSTDKSGIKVGHGKIVQWHQGSMRKQMTKQNRTIEKKVGHEKRKS